MEKWEYKIISPDVKGFVKMKIDPKTEQLLNELGNEGWELVSLAPLAGNAYGWGAGTGNFVLIFKRQKI